MDLKFKEKLVDMGLYRLYVEYLHYIIIDQFCSKNSNSIDVGCYRGQFTFSMAQKSKKVYAFDPLNDIINSLNDKPDLNNFLNYLIWPNFNLMESIEYYSTALGDKQQSGNFYIFDLKSRSSFCRKRLDSMLTLVEHKKMTIMTLDDFYLDNISFIKINAEGYDLKVIKGSTNLLIKEQPYILAEFVTSDKSFKDYDVSFLADLNYNYFSVIPEFNNLEFVLFYSKNKSLKSLLENIKEYNFFWEENINKLINAEISLNKFKLFLINYFKKLNYQIITA